jgi:hypothetical protein
MVQSKRIALYVLYAIIIVLVVWGLVEIFKPSSSNTVHKTSSSTSTPATPAKNNSSSTKSSAPAGSSRGQTTISNTGTRNGALTNTGPGDVVGLFAVTSIISAVLWRRKLVR